MTIRHRVMNRLVGWRVLHAFRLWVVVRAGMWLVTGLFSGGGFSVATGIDVAILAATAVSILDWLDERRFGIGMLYANFGYDSLAIRVFSAGVAFVAELLLALALWLAQ